MVDQSGDPPHGLLPARWRRKRCSLVWRSNQDRMVQIESFNFWTKCIGPLDKVAQNQSAAGVRYHIELTLVLALRLRRPDLFV
jgi:hypothetical protein